MALIAVMYVALISGVAGKKSAEGEIRDLLLQNEYHSPRDRPVLNSNDTVVVGISVDFYAMLDLNEKDQVITTASWLTMTWKDVRMTWDPSNFSGVDLVSMYADEIWIPKVFVTNSVSGDELVNPQRGSILLTSEGTVLLGQPVVQSTQCPMDITYFPFDVQSCPFQYFTENILAHQVYIYIIPNYDGHKLPSTEWNLLNVTSFSWYFPVENYIENHSREYDWSFGIVCVHLERDSSYYVSALLIPSTLLCLMALATFEAPPDSGERISLSVSMVLGLTVFQLLIVSTLPSNSKEPPIIGTYLTSTFIIACLSVPLSMININIAYGDRRLWLLKYGLARNIFLEVLPRIFWMPTYRERVEGQLVDAAPQTVSVQNTKVMATADIDEKSQALSTPDRCKEKLSHTEKRKREARTVALVMDKLVLICLLISFAVMAVVVTLKFRQNPGIKEEICYV